MQPLVIYLFFYHVFPDEPGKQVQSAIRIKNTSKSHVAFKVGKSCILFSSLCHFVFLSLILGSCIS